MTLQHAFRSHHEGRPGWKLEFTYDAETVEALKAAIPHTMRSWNPEKKLWWVHQDYEEALLHMFPYFAMYRDQRTLL